MASRSKRFLWLTVPAAAGLLLATNLVLPTFANAAAPPQYVSRKSAFDSSATKSVLVRCPSGTVVSGVSGGTPSPSALLWTEHRIIDARTVKVIGTEDPAGYSGNWELYATAVCTLAAGHEVVHRTKGDADNIFTASSACPAGKLLTGLGGSGDGSNARLLAMVPTRTKASTTAYDLWTWDGVLISTTIDIVCVDELIDLQVVKSTLASDPSRPSTSQYVHCPAGTVAYGAGYKVSGPSRHDVVLNWTSVDPGGAGATATVRVEDWDYSLTAYAVCGKSG
jgi:hypothetical protein